MHEDPSARTTAPAASTAAGSAGSPSIPKRRIGLALQGGVIPAGAFASGVVAALVEMGAFAMHEFVAFSGTSAGALVAAMCWGHALEDRIAQLPGALEQQWLALGHGTIPNFEFAHAMLAVDRFARLNPWYDWFAQQVRVPYMQDRMRQWTSEHLRIRDWQRRLAELRSACQPVPGLLMGAVDALEGDIKVFEVLSPEDFDLDTVVASGSLEEINGLTTIRRGAHEGTYMDGAWAINPPISILSHYGVDEIWLVQIYPKKRARLPATLTEREDRQHELWQNSYIEHEAARLEFVNKWRDALNAQRASIDAQHPPFRTVDMHVIPMERDLPIGAKLVNDRAFIEDMIDYGYHQGRRFMQTVVTRQVRVQPVHHPVHQDALE